MSKARLYRLHVEFPPDSIGNEDWYPVGFDTEQAWTTEAETGAPYMEPWHWPRRRVYLSRSGAARMASKLRGWGCEVRLEASEPIVWLPGGPVPEREGGG